MADATSITFYGLWNQAGRTVRAWVTGLYCGDYFVGTNGQVTVPFGSDPDGLFTITRVQQAHADGLITSWGPLGVPVDVFIDPTIISYVIPAVFGFGYTSQGQLPRPASEGEIKSSTGSGLAKPRQINQIGVLLNGAIGVSFGVSFDFLTPAVFTDHAGTVLDSATMFSGVHQMPIIPDYGKYDCEMCWQISLPYPCTLISMTGFLHTEEVG